MDHKIFSEQLLLYSTSRQVPNTTSVSLTMRDPVNEKALNSTFKTAIKRYPYFQVKLVKEGEEIFFADNHEPVAILNTDEPVTIGGAESNGHLLAVSWSGNIIRIHFHQALTDLTGIYQLIKTFLYYYCSRYYSTTLSSCRIRFTGEDPAEEEWTDPVECFASEAEDITESRERSNSSPEDGVYSSSFSLRIPEKDYLEKATQLACAPENMAALVLARAIYAFNETGNDKAPVFMMISKDWRNYMKTPLAHQPLTGNICIEINEKLAAGTFEELAAGIEGVTYGTAAEETIRRDILKYRAEARMIDSLSDMAKKHSCCADILESQGQGISAAVVFPQMADYDDAEQFVQEMHVSSSGAAMGVKVPVVLSLTNMNGYFYMDIRMQEGREITRKLLAELEKAGLKAELLENNTAQTVVSDEMLSLIG